MTMVLLYIEDSASQTHGIPTTGSALDRHF